MISEKALVTNGTSTIYSADFEIKSEDHCNVLIAGVIQSSDTYDVINNAIVFHVAPVTGQALLLRVGTTESDLASAPTDIGICATNITSINSVAGNTTNINAVNANSADVTTVATNIASVNTTAADIANVNAVAGNETNINSAVANETNINAAVANTTNINSAVSNATNINAAVANETNINAVVADASNINTVATNVADVNTVAGIGAAGLAGIVANETNINVVGTNIANVNTTATNIASVNTVAGNTANVSTVAGIDANVTTVAGISADVTAAATNAADITAVATEVAKVVEVANDLQEAISEIDTVATNIASVNTVGTNISAINNVSTNIADINNFNDTYFVSATAPTSPTIGDLWFDSTASTMKVYSASGWQNAGSSVNGIENSVEHIATAGQTSFTATYDPGYLNVFLNGVKLDSTDYTATTGSTVVLDTGATVGDSVFVQSFGTFALADHYSKIASDARYLQLTGGTVTGSITATDFVGPLNGAIQFTAKNTSGGTLTVGQVVYISGISGNTPTVELADADDAAKMPAYGLVAVAAADNDPVEITTFGPLTNVKTDYAGWQVGDTLYVSTTPGTLTNVAPTGEGTLLQNLGRIRRVQQSAGSITVGGAGRTNATPNLNDGNVFIGNASNQAAARALVIGDTTGLQTALDNINTDLVNDTTPQLGGDLDLNGHVITGLSTDPTMGGDLSGTASNAQIGANTVTDTELNSAKLNGIATGATNVTNNNQISNGAGYVTTSGANTSLSNLSATGEQRLCHAWVSWVGTGTVTIRDSYNVSSISDRGTGQYTVNLTTAMPNANYAPLVTGMKGSTDDGYMMTDIGTGGYTASTIQVTGRIGSSGPDDLPVLIVAVFGD
jgi:hypothetical protein